MWSGWESNLTLWQGMWVSTIVAYLPKPHCPFPHFLFDIFLSKIKCLRDMMLLAILVEISMISEYKFQLQNTSCAVRENVRQFLRILYLFWETQIIAINSKRSYQLQIFGMGTEHRCYRRCCFIKPMHTLHSIDRLLGNYILYLIFRKRPTNAYLHINCRKLLPCLRMVAF